MKLAKVYIYALILILQFLSGNVLIESPVGVGFGVTAPSFTEGLQAYGHNTSGVITEKKELGVYFSQHLAGTLGVNAAFLFPVNIKDKVNITSGVNLLFSTLAGFEGRDDTGALTGEKYNYFTAFLFTSIKFKNTQLGIDINQFAHSKNKVFTSQKEFSFGLSGKQTFDFSRSRMVIAIAANNILAGNDNEATPFHLNDSIHFEKKLNKLTSIGIGIGHTLYLGHNLIGIGGMFKSRASVAPRAGFDALFSFSYQFTTQKRFANPSIAGLKLGLELNIRDIIQLSYGFQNAGKAGVINKMGLSTRF